MMYKHHNVIGNDKRDGLKSFILGTISSQVSIEETGFEQTRN